MLCPEPQAPPSPATLSFVEAASTTNLRVLARIHKDANPLSQADQLSVGVNSLQPAPASLLPTQQVSTAVRSIVGKHCAAAATAGFRAQHECPPTNRGINAVTAANYSYKHQLCGKPRLRSTSSLLNQDGHLRQRRQRRPTPVDFVAT